MVPNDILRAVQDQIEQLQLTLPAAAKAIGISTTALQRHLSGEYVRSDSLAKYRIWLQGANGNSARNVRRSPHRNGNHANGQSTLPLNGAAVDSIPELLHADRRDGEGPFQVVDLFSGCGGLSLGFDLFAPSSGGTHGGHRVFETVLALDIDPKMVELHNRNHPGDGELHSQPARWVDLTDFQSEGEILAFYLDHLAELRRDGQLRRALDRIGTGLRTFKQHIRFLDVHFLETLKRIRETADFRQAYRQLDSTIFNQTSVIGFHDALRLPASSTAAATSIGPLVWSNWERLAADAPQESDLHQRKLYARKSREAAIRLSEVWDREVEALVDRTKQRARGQLASSAGRIAHFVQFLKSPPMRQVFETWLQWRSKRDALREVAFADPHTAEQLRSLYGGDRQVDVLLGGPPCQGFSRIGRGKIRSLQEGGVHVRADAQAGDARNRLMEQYVLCVSALRPRIFLFENVRHFKAEVRTSEGTFRAAELLNDAITDLSHDRVSYAVSDRIVDSSMHLVPQTRERFFLAGVRKDIAHRLGRADLPAYCLSLKNQSPIPLRVALCALPSPHAAVDESSGGTGGLSRIVEIDTGATELDASSSPYLAWIRQTPPSGVSGASSQFVDGHVARVPRPDDSSWFKLMGPGRRWMDYRCDGSETLAQLTEYISALLDAARAAQNHSDRKHPSLELLRGLDTGALQTLLDALDGSLSLRLLLECIPLRDGEVQHHLLTPSYLAKGSGNNGDWIARLHPDTPSRTMVSHMSKDTYQYVHPSEPRTLSVREAARIQSFPDWFRFGDIGLVDGFRAIGNAVPPLLSCQLAANVATILRASNEAQPGGTKLALLPRAQDG